MSRTWKVPNSWWPVPLSSFRPLPGTPAAMLPLRVGVYALVPASGGKRLPGAVSACRGPGGRGRHEAPPAIQLSDLISIGRDPPTLALACRQGKRSCRRRDRVCACCSRVCERVSRRIWGAPPVTAKGRAPAILLIGSGRALPRHPLAIPTFGRDPSCSLPRTFVRAVAGPMKPLRTSETSRPGAPPGDKMQGFKHCWQAAVRQSFDVEERPKLATALLGV